MGALAATTGGRAADGERSFSGGRAGGRAGLERKELIIHVAGRPAGRPEAVDMTYT